ncbi:hypothetical protein J5500_04165 [Candidatus Saccharibacteria bacterium]|nr:hypothetical protein [Candidatus Saccharibacteria bacterium]
MEEMLKDPAFISLLFIPAFLLFFSAVFYGFFFKRLFIKAGRKPGDAYIPLYNLYQLTKIAGLPGLVVLLFFFPTGAYLWRALVGYSLAKAFGFEKQECALMALFGLMMLPITCVIISSANSTYLLDEEIVAKSRVKGFSASSTKEEKSRRK